METHCEVSLCLAPRLCTTRSVHSYICVRAPWQVVAEYVQPLAARCAEVMAHRKWRPGGVHGVTEDMKAERARLGRGQPYQAYYVALGTKHPHAFTIVFCVSESVHKDMFYATPKGFYFRYESAGWAERVLC